MGRKKSPFFRLLIMRGNPIFMVALDGSTNMVTLSDLIFSVLRVLPSCIILLVFLIVSVYVLRLIRANLSKTELRPTDYLESFQKLHEKGELSPEEYRLVRRLVSLQITRNPDEPINYSLLNKTSPSPPADKSSGNIPKN